jgi:hypothetical protein
MDENTQADSEIEDVAQIEETNEECDKGAEEIEDEDNKIEYDCDRRG